MPITSVRDTAVHYLVDGQGPGLVLVHGMGGDAETVFGNVVDHFSGDHTVVRPNFSGSGETRDGGGDLTVDLIADQVAAATSDAVAGPVDVLGFSLGAVDRFGHDGLAWSLADQWPPPGIGRQIDLGLRVDIRDLLPAITAPTLVIGFADDAMIPVDGSRQLHAGIPGSRLVEVPGEGHMDWFADPTDLVELTRGFLADAVAPTTQTLVRA